MVNILRKRGTAIILMLCIITFIIWAMIEPIALRFSDYASSTHSLGQITGLIGMVLFAWTFVLSSRAKWVEDSFDGLDKMYKAHHMIGSLAFVLILFHPILLVVKFIPSDWNLAATYLWPSGSWAVNFGIVALLLMIFLLVLTFYIRMKYEKWRISHQMLGVAYVLAIIHIFMVTTDISRSIPLKVWMIIICLIGLIAHLQVSYLKLGKRFEYTVYSVETNNKFTTIILRPKGNAMKFKSGQFAYIKFNKRGFEERHPFTIAVKQEDKIGFVIKNLGDYTSHVSELESGVTADVEGPYGRFDYTQANKDQIWIAGGIGITPFLSFSNDIPKTKFKHNISLYYCAVNDSELVYWNELNKISETMKNFHVIPFCADKRGRISVDVLERESGILNKAFFICGPPPMMQSLKDALVKRGVKKEDIHREDFSFK